MAAVRVLTFNTVVTRCNAYNASLCLGSDCVMPRPIRARYASALTFSRKSRSASV